MPQCPEDEQFHLKTTVKVKWNNYSQKCFFLFVFPLQKAPRWTARTRHLGFRWPAPSWVNFCWVSIRYLKPFLEFWSQRQLYEQAVQFASMTWPGMLGWAVLVQILLFTCCTSIPTHSTSQVLSQPVSLISLNKIYVFVMKSRLTSVPYSTFIVILKIQADLAPRFW